MILSPIVSYITGVVTILLALFVLIALALIVARFDIPRPRIEWFALGCMTGTIAALALLFAKVR